MPQATVSTDASTEPGSALADDLLWGAAAVADELGISTRKAFYLLSSKAIPARKINGLWVASKQRLRSALTA